jgi:hypothetical protein
MAPNSNQLTLQLQAAEEVEEVVQFCLFYTKKLVLARALTSKVKEFYLVSGNS